MSFLWTILTFLVSNWGYFWMVIRFPGSNYDLCTLIGALVAGFQIERVNLHIFLIIRLAYIPNSAFGNHKIYS